MPDAVRIQALMGRCETRRTASPPSDLLATLRTAIGTSPSSVTTKNGAHPPPTSGPTSPHRGIEFLQTQPPPWSDHDLAKGPIPPRFS